VSRELLIEVLSKARVAVFPSFSEGFAWAPLEAMAYGCPTIFTLLSSGPELITEGRDGLLIDPHRPIHIAEAIVEVLEDAEFAEVLGQNGRAHVLQTFTLEKLLPLNEAFYSHLLTSFQEKRSRGIKRLRKLNVSPNGDCTSLKSNGSRPGTLPDTKF
jgi:glycosyltransferase involved in cell wall biosynthesis